MENIRIGIIAGDRDYALALAFGMTEVRRDLIVEVLPGPGVCTDMDLLLVEEQLVGSMSEQEKTVILCREKADQRMDRREGVYKLWRYSNIRDIVSSIMYIYTWIYGRHVAYVEKDMVRFYGFISPCGGTGCTSVAMAVAQEMERFHGRNVMYISLGQISPVPEYMRTESGGRTIAEYLYHSLGRNRDIWRMKDVPVESFLSRSDSGVEALTASPGRNPLPYLDRDDISRFMSSIAKSARYDTVIIDAGCSLAFQATDALDICDSCCLIRDPYRKGRAAQLYIDHLSSIVNSGITGRMVVADNRRVLLREDERSRILDELFSTDDEDENAGVNRDDNESDGAEKDESGPADRVADVIICFDPDSFRNDGGIRKISLDGSFGIGIKELTEKLIAAAGDS
ncbi:MAG: hypothetical protein IKS63_03910 [Firmicutes bacterium]|nr:hypothetical protein [Bacillota bacterium]